MVENRVASMRMGSTDVSRPQATPLMEYDASCRHITLACDQARYSNSALTKFELSCLRGLKKVLQHNSCPYCTVLINFKNVLNDYPEVHTKKGVSIANQRVVGLYSTAILAWCSQLSVLIHEKGIRDANT